MIARRNIIPVFVPHLGCPNNCVFCNQNRISGEKVSATPETVGKTILEGIAKIPENSNIELAFYGGSFTAIPVEEQNELLDAALPFLHDGRIESLRLSTRPDAIDEEILDRLKTYGVRTIELGAQSMCDEVLYLSGRGHTAMRTEKSACLIKEHGFELILQMMTGLPGDTRERTIETARKIIALKPNGVRIYPTVIVENTPLCDMWREGAYKEHTVEEAVDWCAAVLPLFEEAEITVIRLGLNPTEELSGGAAFGGAYHPALGELVKSRLLLNKARALLSENAHDVNVVLHVNASDVSAMTGQKRSNIRTLCDEFKLKALKVSSYEIQKGKVILG
ncbi:MAG: radical SAM protein [Firmicutes bacterium HGW-Firmicutes-16]|nr:MAG: radical SAM protein [Firmicutes bacterium HGW-Firmicutes-16]